MVPVRDDVRLLSIFHYVLAGLSGCCACFPLLYVGLGAVFALGGSPHLGPNPPPAILGFFMMGAGLFALALLAAWIVALVLAGRFIARQRHWTFCVVVAALSCTSFPLGTALGVFTLVTLNKPDVKALFDARRVG